MELDSLKTPSGILKIVEIVLTAIVLGISQGTDDFYYGGVNVETGAWSRARHTLCSGALILPMVVTPLLLSTYLRGHAKDLWKTPFETKVNAVIATLLLAAGAIMIHAGVAMDKHGLSPLFKEGSVPEKAAGAIAIITSLTYGVDAFFAFRNRE